MTSAYQRRYQPDTMAATGFGAIQPAISTATVPARPITGPVAISTVDRQTRLGKRMAPR